MSAGLRIRPMLPADLAAIHALQCRAYPAAYHEPVEALRSHLEAGAACCFVAERAQALAAYVFAHPWQGPPPALHASLAGVSTPDHLFVHDLAVDPEARGVRAAARLCEAVVAAAHAAGLLRLELVAVGQAAAFWARHGFERLPERALPASYGQAVAMARVLA